MECKIRVLTFRQSATLIAGIILGMLVSSGILRYFPSRSMSLYSSGARNPQDVLMRAARVNCKLACDIARKYESDRVMKHLACADLRPQSIPSRPVPAESVNIIYCTEFSQFFSWYDWMQKIFLAGLLSDPEFRFSGTVLFRIADNSTILAETGIALLNQGIPYLSHAHYISPTAIDCSGQNTTKTCIYQPDFHFIEHRGYQNMIKFLRENSMPLSHRRKVVYWRGSSTGNANTCEDLCRVRMCKASEGIPWLDMKITNHVLLCHGKSYFLANRTKEIDWIQYRGIIDIDGKVNAWGLFWRLGSGSVVFKVHSSYSNFYISQLRPWVEYIPLADDLTDLINQTKVILEDRALVNLETITSNAYELTQRISYSSELIRVRSELNKIQFEV